jgi:hypothetical protein
MTKRVATNDKIEIKAGPDSDTWVDISDEVSRWSAIQQVGEVSRVEIDVIPNSPEISIVIATDRWIVMPESSSVAIRGVDISNIVEGVNHYSKAGNVQYARLHLYGDSDYLRINGQFPWEVQTLAEAA